MTSRRERAAELEALMATEGAAVRERTEGFGGIDAVYFRSFIVQ